MKTRKKQLKGNGLHEAHVYIDKELHEKLRNDADREERSVTGQINFILKNHYNQK